MRNNIEVNGKVEFWENENGILFQRLFEIDNIIEVANGNIEYKFIKEFKNKIIKYNINGVYGFSIWDNDINLEDGIWSIEECENIINDML